MLRKNLLLLLFLSILFFITGNARGQGLNTEFGQNTLQYRDFEWSCFKTENFDTYFYVGGKELASFAARYSESQLGPIGKIIDYRLSGRIELVVYNSLSELKQSNILVPDPPFNPGGTTHIRGNKIFIYFNGNHDDLTRQLKKGITWVLVNEMLYGSSIQERVQNSALLNLPEWYVPGIASYISSEWSVEMDNRLRDIIRSERKVNFNQLVYTDPAFTGHTIWKYLVERYGERAIPNILYLTRITRNLENAFYFVLGFGIGTVAKDWSIYYRNMYARDDENRKLPVPLIILNKKSAAIPHTEIKLSKDGTKLAVVTNNAGKYRIELIELENLKRQTIFKGGYRSRAMPDLSFPLIDWDPVYGFLSAIYEKKGKILLTSFDLEKKSRTHTELTKFDKVNSFDYSDNGRSLVMSAVRKGQSDLYVMDMGSKRERQLTNDLADDLHPRFVNNSNSIIFSSSRQSDSLNPVSTEPYVTNAKLDIFMYDYPDGSKILHRLTRTPHLDETWPLQYNKEFYAYLSEQNGIINKDACSLTTAFEKFEVILRYTDTLLHNDTLLLDSVPSLSGTIDYRGTLYNLDSGILSIDTVSILKDILNTFSLTDYSRNIIAHDASPSGKQAELTCISGRYFYSFRPVLRPDEVAQQHIFRSVTRYRYKTGYVTDSTLGHTNTMLHDRMRLMPFTDFNDSDTVVRINTPYTFLTDFSPTPPSWTGRKKEEKIMRPDVSIGAPKPATLAFSPQYIVTQVDNSVINTYYQPYRPQGKPFFNPGIFAQVKITVTDLMQDYRFSGGFRMAANLAGGTDFFFSFESLKKRLDHNISMFRQSRFTQEENSFLRTITYEGRLTEKYAFTPNSAIRGSAFFRSDKTMFLVTDIINAGKIDAETQRIGGKLEYAFDNTFSRALNLRQGTRLKFFLEVFQPVNNGTGRLSIAGADIRHYIKVHKQIIWANRLAGSTSFGGAKVLFTMGGVDNWLFPSSEANNDPNTQENYVFQSLVTNMRGFKQNIRNGNSYAVFNSELRLPVFTYFSKRPVRSDVLRNFLIVPFFDFGTAWNGPNPYSDKNAFNKKIIEQGPIRIEILNLKSPFIAGYGMGFRLRILSYSVRTDFAYGIEDGEIKKPMAYFSLSLDF